MIDHIAINVDDIEAAVEWYKNNLNLDPVYEDKSWAMLTDGKTKLALTLPTQHPPHIAVKVNDLNSFPGKLSDISTHRDGSSYLYLKDPWGNTIEWVFYNAK